MLQKYKNFIRGVAINRIGKAGVVITTTVFITFILFETSQSLGMIRNAYFGLITYLLFPVLFIIGLICIPIGWHQYRKTTGKSTRELLNEQFEQTDIQPGPLGSPLTRTIVMLTVVNVLILSLSGIRMLHFMDQAKFCGTACHTVMNPEWVTYQKSPHARVKCVECHVGEGVDALIASKLNGVRQMYLAAFHLYHRPIPTPVHTLRPARETCEHCHWPEKFYGQRLVTHIHYGMDSLSTPRYSTLNVKIDAGSDGHQPGAHWHVAESNRITFTSVNDEREKMITVTAWHNNENPVTYTNRNIESYEPAGKKERKMDCVDCHNRATHIYKQAEDVVDQLIRQGDLDRDLPFIKREALAALTFNYPSEAAAMKGIANQLANYYKRYEPTVSKTKQPKIEHAITLLQQAYTTFRHHHMRIEWGTYTSHIGHQGDTGCFRCHNPDMVNDQGQAIRNDCTLCHSILAMDSEKPFQYLEPAKENAPDRKMHEWMQQEFLNNFY